MWTHGAKYAILIFEDSTSWVGREVILDLSETIHQLKVPLIISRVETSPDSKSLMESLEVVTSELGSMVAVTRDMVVVDRFTGVTPDRKQWVAAVKKFIWDHSSEFSIKESDKIIKTQDSDNVSKKSDNMKQKTGTRKEIMTRRYKVHMSDLEKTIVYAISHEVAQHSSITSHTLAALQQFVTVLQKYFPGRIEMSLLLRELKSWVHKHQDTIRGEDLSSWFLNYQTKHNIKVSPQWQGCRGSADMYGGYPCGLWSLWHVLTVHQANMAEGDPKEVMMAMKSYIQEFFGCRECARHFDQVIQ